MKYEEYSEMIPLYLAGRMDPGEQAEFEALASAHVELRMEVDELRPVFEALNRDFIAANETQFALSPARRAELRRETDANVIRFPGSRDTGGAKSGTRSRLPLRPAYRWAGIAAAVLFITLFGLQDAQQRPDIGELPLQTASLDPPQSATADAPQRVYVYPPGYGLDRPDPWRLRGRKQTAELTYARISQPVGDEGFDHFMPMDDSRPNLLGLDGPRPYYGISTLRGPGAI